MCESRCYERHQLILILSMAESDKTLQICVQDHQIPAT